MSEKIVRPNWRVIVEIDGKISDWKDSRPLAEIINSYLEKVGKKLPNNEKLV